LALLDINDPGTGSLPTTYLSNAHVENMTFSTEGFADVEGVQLLRVNSSTVNGCTFYGGEFGIADTHTLTGNSYSNNSFDGNRRSRRRLSSKILSLLFGGGLAAYFKSISWNCQQSGNLVSP
jgi:nitrous oxidase accessory protein NosD